MDLNEIKESLIASKKLAMKLQSSERSLNEEVLLLRQELNDEKANHTREIQRLQSELEKKQEEIEEKQKLAFALQDLEKENFKLKAIKQKFESMVEERNEQATVLDLQRDELSELRFANSKLQDEIRQKEQANQELIHAKLQLHESVADKEETIKLLLEAQPPAELLKNGKKSKSFFPFM